MLGNIVSWFLCPSPEILDSAAVLTSVNADHLRHCFHDLCVGVSLSLRGLLQKLRLMLLKGLCRTSVHVAFFSLSISFNNLCHQTNKRAFPKVSSATMRE